MSKPYFYKPTRVAVVCVGNLVYHLTVLDNKKEFFHLTVVFELLFNPLFKDADYTYTCKLCATLIVRLPNYKTFQTGDIFEVITNKFKADKINVDIKMMLVPLQWFKWYDCLRRVHNGKIRMCFSNYITHISYLVLYMYDFTER